MTNSISPKIVDAFYRAYNSGDPDQISAFLDQDVEWCVIGPLEVMQHCGHWKGKAAVVDRFARIVPSIFEYKHIDIEHLLVDGNQSAAFGKITCRYRASSRLISYLVSHLVLYRDGKVLYFRSANDSLDAVEQFIGHQITLKNEPSQHYGNLVTI